MIKTFTQKLKRTTINIQTKKEFHKLDDYKINFQKSIVCPMSNYMHKERKDPFYKSSRKYEILRNKFKKYYFEIK